MLENKQLTKSLSAPGGIYIGSFFRLIDSARTTHSRNEWRITTRPPRCILEPMIILEDAGV